MPGSGGETQASKSGNPVLTFRSPDKLTERIEAYAARYDIPRGRAIRQLIVMGLRAERSSPCQE